MIRSHPMNCGIYIDCSSGQPAFNMCPPGQFYDSSIDQCDEQDRVLRKCLGEDVPSEQTTIFTTELEMTTMMTTATIG